LGQGGKRRHAEGGHILKSKNNGEIGSRTAAENTKIYFDNEGTPKKKELPAEGGRNENAPQVTKQEYSLHWGKNGKNSTSPLKTPVQPRAAERAHKKGSL